ncbi:MAG: KpsF/GutQ family sugar-phosphate isomerase [SAR324 cluster bacterium]|nr:KpsF/GutQ family sugar-phosphate isomerase [SAR324 cluster bacterium]MCZ6841906.1 KpsF/GutQ family sugar-phosphate isomerase [SAR324 cluster bacterium]
MSDILKAARTALQIEIEGLNGLLDRLGAPFEEAVRLIMDRKGKVIVAGVGKSGHVGRKIAGTLASTGTMALFLHPAEAIHGDLGVVTQDDVMLAISNSGQTEELIRLLAPLRRIGVPVIAMTGNPDSELARRAEIHLDVSVEKEACPMGLAPTASTTAALAMGDAIAVCLLELRNFTPEDYAVFHPGGNLGKQLVTTVADLMETGDKLPVVDDTETVQQVIEEMQAKRYGLTAVVNGAGLLQGVFSMGDFTRLHLRDKSLAFMGEPISAFITTEPKTITPDALAARALNTMETHSIRALFVVDKEGKPIGIIGLYEVLKAIDY